MTQRQLFKPQSAPVSDQSWKRLCLSHTEADLEGLISSTPDRLSKVNRNLRTYKCYPSTSQRWRLSGDVMTWPAGKLQTREVQLAKKLTRETGSRREASCKEIFHWQQRARMERTCFLSRVDPYVTRTMRDSVWTEGKPQSPPQHLSSMAAAMFDSWVGPVTSSGDGPIHSQGREGTPGQGKQAQRIRLY